MKTESLWGGVAVDAVYVAWSRLSRRTKEQAELLGMEPVFIPYGSHVKAWLGWRRGVSSPGFGPDW